MVNLRQRLDKPNVVTSEEAAVRQIPRPSIQTLLIATVAVTSHARTFMCTLESTCSVCSDRNGSVRQWSISTAKRGWNIYRITASLTRKRSLQWTNFAKAILQKNIATR